MATTGASLEEIYKRLKNTERSRPMSANTFTDWTTEAGDTVTVKREGTSYTSQVQNTTMTWKGNGAQTVINSTGNEKRDAVSKVSKSKYGRNGGAMRNQQGLYSDVWDEDGHVHSVISQTASTINAYVENTYNRMKAGLALTSSSAALYVRNMYDKMASGLMLTSSSVSAYVTSAYDRMKAGLNITSSSVSAYVTSAYDRMKAGLNITSSSIAQYVESEYDKLKAGLNITSSSISQYVTTAYDRMKAGLKITSSSIAQYVTSAYDRMKAGINITSSSIAHYVTTAYDRMKAGLNITSSSAAVYANSRTSKAAIIARINEDGTSEALINADRVSISGRTTINDVMTISDNKFYVKTNARINGDVMMETLTLRQANDSVSIGEADLENVIKKATVSGNTLTLTPILGNAITFSKATSQTGTWSGSTLDVKATQTNGGTTSTVHQYYIGFGGSYGTHDTELEVVPNGNVSASSISKAIEVPIAVRSLNSAQTAPTSRYTKDLTVSLSPVLTSLTGSDKITSNGTYEPSDGNLGFSKVVVDVPSTSYDNRTLYCSDVQDTYPGSSTKYYYFRLEGNYGTRFSKGTNYVMYRPSW